MNYTIKQLATHVQCMMSATTLLIRPTIYLADFLLVIQLDERIEPASDDHQMASHQNVEQFAIKVDTNSPVDDFHEKIPNMAYKVLSVACSGLMAHISNSCLSLVIALSKILLLCQCLTKSDGNL